MSIGVVHVKINFQAKRQKNKFKQRKPFRNYKPDTFHRSIVTLRLASLGKGLHKTTSAFTNAPTTYIKYHLAMYMLYL